MYIVGYVPEDSLPDDAYWDEELHVWQTLSHSPEAEELYDAARVRVRKLKQDLSKNLDPEVDTAD